MTQDNASPAPNVTAAALSKNLSKGSFESFLWISVLLIYSAFLLKISSVQLAQEMKNANEVMYRISISTDLVPTVEAKVINMPIPAELRVSRLLSRSSFVANQALQAAA